MKTTRAISTAACAACWIAGLFHLAAHQTLYHNLEVSLRDPAIIRMFVTVHAPELPSAIAAGVDPTAVDDSWLRSRSDAELSVLFEEAERFVREIFYFAIVPLGDAPLVTIGPEPLPLQFETREQIRDPAYDNGLPAGCFLVTIELPNPGSPQGLEIAFSPKADKRLLLAVARPAAFPEAHDLDAGGSLQIELPEAPPTPKVDRTRHAIIIGTSLAAVALFAWLAFRRRVAR